MLPKVLIQWLPIVLFGLAFMALAPLLISAATPPKSVLQKTPTEQLVAMPANASPTEPRVLFAHDTHTSIECGLCHHNAAPLVGQTVQKCSDAGCHADMATRSGASSFYAAFHNKATAQSCLGCHTKYLKRKKKAGPTSKCAGCHQIQATSEASVQPAKVEHNGATQPVGGGNGAISPYAKRKSGAPSLSMAPRAAGMATTGAPAPFHLGATPGDVDREQYAKIDPNPVKRAAEAPVSTFAVDVDTGSYANVRRFLNQGALPPKDAVRVEELVNYFGYDYPLPSSREVPFKVDCEIGPAPWNKDALLLRVGLKGYTIEQAERPAANLVFLIDVSGSMDEPNKLPLLKAAFKLLTQQLAARDRVSIVVYAGAAGVALESTPGDQTAKILAAVERLKAGGSTAGGEGIKQAYAMARQAYIKDGINRIILATDGDFNVGVVNFEALLGMVERERSGGISLTTLGFGQGNYNDRLMEQLAAKGKGSYAYIDTLNEANKVLATELSSTIFTIAKDVKAQLEFNPARVAEYRLIGYENRLLKREDFANDKVDGGDIGAGHTVTALYELALVGSPSQRLEPLRYGAEQPKAAPSPDAADKKTEMSGELGFLKLRYKLPAEDTSRLLELPLAMSMVKPALSATTDEFRFAAAVAAFGQLLRDGKYTGSFGYAEVLELARSARGRDPYGYRGEFLGLVQLTAALARK